MRPDVLHVLYLKFWPDKRISIVKLVENIIANSSLTQASVPSPRDLDVFLNAARPPIIHLHYSSPHPENVFLEKLDYSPRIIHTVHGSERSAFSDIASRIVCISEFGLRNNDPDKTVYIENSVDASGLPRHRPNDNGACAALRFAAFQMDAAVLGLFGRLQAPVHIFGSDDALSYDAAHNEAIIKAAGDYPNVRVLPYCNYLEYLLHGYSFLAYYIANNNPARCYGVIVMEAVSIGMPVVAVRRKQGGQEFNIHGYNGYIADSDEQFLRYCSMLLEDRALYASMCANAAEHSRSIRNEMPGRYEDLYRSLL